MAATRYFFYNRAVDGLYSMQFVTNSKRKEKIKHEDTRLSENQQKPHSAPDR